MRKSGLFVLVSVQHQFSRFLLLWSSPPLFLLHPVWELDVVTLKQCGFYHPINLQHYDSQESDTPTPETILIRNHFLSYQGRAFAFLQSNYNEDKGLDILVRLPIKMSVNDDERGSLKTKKPSRRFVLVLCLPQRWIHQI